MTAFALPPPPAPSLTPNLPPTQAGGPPQPSYPYSRMAGYSVLRVLAPTSPPKGSFWFGMALLFIGLVLTGCPLLLGVALGVGAGATSPMVASLAVSGCFALVFVLPGAMLLASGRPKR